MVFFNLLSICGETVEESDVRWGWHTRKKAKGDRKHKANCKNRLYILPFEGIIDVFFQLALHLQSDSWRKWYQVGMAYQKKGKRGPQTQSKLREQTLHIANWGDYRWFFSTCSPFAVRQLKKVMSGGDGIPEKRQKGTANTKQTARTDFTYCHLRVL